jgi:NTP pyrophosphatase (non-canonical NTP hydrolase)
MEMKERLEALEKDLQQTKEELQDILLDIRTYLMEVQSPIGSSTASDKHDDELDAERG